MMTKEEIRKVVIEELKKLTHSALSGMPDAAGANRDHDTAYHRRNTNLILNDFFLEAKEITAPNTPGTAKARVYLKDSAGTTKLCMKDDAGAETVFGGGGVSGVDSFEGRTGVVVATANDYTWGEIDKTASSIADITTKNIDLLSDVDTVSDAPVKDEVLKWNGTQWVPATYDYSFVLTFDSFTDNQAATQLIGAGAVWMAIGAIDFTATFTNGPPASMVVTVSCSVAFEGGVSGWTGNILTMTASSTHMHTLEATNYPVSRGGITTFSAQVDALAPRTTTVTFQNYIWYGKTTETSGWDSTDINALTGTLTSTYTGNWTGVTAGAGEYLLFAHPSAYTSIHATGFLYQTMTCAFEAAATVSVTNSAGFVENYKVYRSTAAAIGAGTLATSTSSTIINELHWGVSTTSTGWSSAQINALTGTIVSNTVARTMASINSTATNYVIYAYPDRIATDIHHDGFLFNGVTCHFENAEVISVTNDVGYVEDYRVYRSTNAEIGNSSLVTSTSATLTNYMFYGSDAGNPVNEAQIEDMDTKCTYTGWTTGKMISNTKGRTVVFGPAGVGEYVWYCYPKRLGTATVTIDGVPGGFQAPVEVSVTNVNGYAEDYYCYRSDYTANVEKTYVWT